MKYPVTAFGFNLLEEELKLLKTVERPSVIKAIAEARAHGDLSENAEYDAAKNKQAFIEGRIAYLEERVNLAHIIDPKTIDHGNRVIFGATVTIIDLEIEKQFTYQLVGDDEADIKLGKISINSPVAMCLVGKSVNDVVEVRIPSGLKEYEILEINY